jgi:phosphoribosylaminoimidazole (AIR) synthetase
MGCGLLVIVPQKDAATAVDALRKAGEVAWVAGRLVAGTGARLVP